MERVIIDCDPGIDDALALMLALEAPQLKVEAITTVDGNVSLDRTTGNTAAVLELCGRGHIPIHKGAAAPIDRDPMPASKAHGGDGLGDVGYGRTEADVASTDAVSFLLAATAAAPGEISWLAVGPLTNLAEAIRRDGDLPSRVKRLVIMGGAEFTGNITPSAEFNFLHDPEAAAEVFRAGFADIVMVGLDATRQVFMSPNLRELVRQLGGPYGQFITAVTRSYMDHYWRKYREVGAELCDPLAAAYLLDPSILDLVEARVEVVTEGPCDGRSVVWRTERYRDQVANCRVATTVDAKRFFELFLTTLFPTDHDEIQRALALEYAN